MDISWIQDIKPFIGPLVVVCFAILCVPLLVESQGKRNTMLWVEEQAKNGKQVSPFSLDMQIQEPNEMLVENTCSCVHEVPCKFCNKMPTIQIAESSNAFSDNPYAEIECTNCGILVADDTGKNREDCISNVIRKWNGMMR